MNFERIRRVMEVLDWRWFGVNDTEGHIPTVEELKSMVSSLLSQLDESPASTIMCGGFMAYRLNGVGERQVSFVIDTYTPPGEGTVSDEDVH